MERMAKYLLNHGYNLIYLARKYALVKEELNFNKGRMQNEKDINVWV